MLAVQARYDGKKIVLPKAARKAAPGKVIVVFEDAPMRRDEARRWLKAQEPAFAKAWDNDADAIYDQL